MRKDRSSTGSWPADAHLVGALRAVLKCAPSAFAVTRDATHMLVHANAAFDRLIGRERAGHARSIVDLMLPEAGARLRLLLDRALGRGEVVHNRFLGALTTESEFWSCTIWPLFNARPLPDGLVIELHRSAPISPNRALQREVAGRLLIAALNEAELAARAQASLAEVAFLAETDRRLGSSRSTSSTRTAVAGLSLPILNDWCIVDLIESDGSYLRLTMIHPDQEKQLLLDELAAQWSPEPGDPFGAPAIRGQTTPLIVDQNVDAALELAAHSAENLRVLRKLDIATLMTVPMLSGSRLLGAVTFVSANAGRAYSAEEIELAENLVVRSADALESARKYDEALLLREQAELLAQTKLRFLGNISHELRTPLNAVLAYIEVISAEIHGPVTPAQRGDLERISLNQKHLLSLVDELLVFVRAGVPRFNEIIEIEASKAVAHAVSLIGNMMARKSLTYSAGEDIPDLVALGDAERTHQILVNLIANAVKFTPRGGRISTHCSAVNDRIHISVLDTGIGIAPSQLEAIFQPFVQVDPQHPVDGGVGLGLAISRELARTMDGDLTVESTIGKGACFTLSLPRASKRAATATTVLNSL